MEASLQNVGADGLDVRIFRLCATGELGKVSSKSRLTFFRQLGGSLCHLVRSARKPSQFRREIGMPGWLEVRRIPVVT